jgi:hypothetical protein
MLRAIKQFARLFMSDEPPRIHCLFPRTTNNLNALDWCNGILGRDFPITSLSSLDQLHHCKATKPPAHEFLLVYFTINVNGLLYKIGMIVDRCPAKEIDKLPNDTSAPSFIVSPSPTPSPSPSPSIERLQASLGKAGKSVAATDRVMIPRFGRQDELKALATETFGTYDTLNSLFIDNDHASMSASQFATLVEIVHNLAPVYDLRKHQCYWFAFIIFLVVRDKTGGRESNGHKIELRGTWWYFTPEHSACDDEKVAKDEYDKARNQLNVGR